MCSHGIRFIQVCQLVAMRIELPKHLFEVLYQSLTLGIDQQAMHGMVSQHGIHTVDAVFDRRIGTRAHGIARLTTIRITAKEVPRDLPVGARGRGLTLLTGGVTIHVNVQQRWFILPQHFLKGLIHVLGVS